MADPSQFLTPAQVSALVASTPWPYSVYVHTAAWSGLRAGELCGLVIADLDLPAPSINPNAPAETGALQVRRTIIRDGGALAYNTPKTRGSRRTVPLTGEATQLLRDYLAEHPRASEPDAPLFSGMRLTPVKPTGIAAEQDVDSETRNPRATEASKNWQAVANRQAKTLADLTVADAQSRLILDWSAPLRYLTFYKAVFRPAVVRVNRLFPLANVDGGLVFHSRRHTYASLHIAVGIPTFKVSRFMGHSKQSTTETIYAHLLSDDHSESMAALGAMNTPNALAGGSVGNVIPLRG